MIIIARCAHGSAHCSSNNSGRSGADQRIQTQASTCKRRQAQGCQQVCAARAGTRFAIAAVASAYRRTQAHLNEQKRTQAHASAGGRKGEYNCALRARVRALQQHERALTGAHQCIQTHTRASKRTQAHTSEHKRTQVHTRCVQAHTSAHKRTQVHTSAYKRTQVHTSAYKRIQAHTSAYKRRPAQS